MYKLRRNVSNNLMITTGERLNLNILKLIDGDFITLLWYKTFGLMDKQNVVLVYIENEVSSMDELDTIETKVFNEIKSNRLLKGRGKYNSNISIRLIVRLNSSINTKEVFDSKKSYGVIDYVILQDTNIYIRYIGATTAYRLGNYYLLRLLGYQDESLDYIKLFNFTDFYLKYFVLFMMSGLAFGVLLNVLTSSNFLLITVFAIPIIIFFVNIFSALKYYVRPKDETETF